MGPLIHRSRRFALALCFSTLTICATYAQSSATCVVGAVPPQVRAEGLTERLGDVTLQCSGTPGAVLSGSLAIFVPANLSNRVNASNQAADAVLYVDYGTGYTPTGIPGVVSPNSITFSNYRFTAPASGKVNLKISGIRAGGFSAMAGQPLIGAISANGLLLNQSQVVLAYPQLGLYATLYDKGVTCAGSPLPSTITLSNLFAAKTIFFSTRLTEGFGSAFLVRGTGDDNGTRFLVKYSGFPANAQLYVPDWVAGSNAATPTAGGDFGQTQSGGQYLPGSGTLLLARVQGADAMGAGGLAVGAPSGSSAVSFDTANAVTLTNGSGYVVYEVVDANNNAIESAQFPTFLGLSNVTAPATANESVSFAAVSTVTAASQTAPVPRFLATVPTSDCSIVGDCQAGYFPKLTVTTVPTIQLAGFAGGLMTSLPGYIPVNNAGGGIMNWTANIVYQNGSGWLKLDTTSGQNSGSVRVFASAVNLTAGTYNATVTIDAGPLAGTATIPVVFTVGTPATTGSSGTNPPPAPTAPAISVSSVVNAATFAQTPVVAGSLATVMGKNLAGKAVAVTFDGAAATLLYTSDTQINLEVPASLATKASASMVVTVDGVASAPVTVPLAPAWPSIFNPGVLNQDNTVNSASAPTQPGTVLQIYATGIPVGATVWANIGGADKQVPLYAGPAPGISGVQQVNVMIPAGVAGGTAPLYLCAMADGQQYCSNTYNLAISH